MAEPTGGAKPMTAEEALKTAIEFETKVRDTYLSAMEEAKDETGKRVFRVLAKEEQGHLDYLFHRQKELAESGDIVPEKVDRYVPSREQLEAKVGSLKGSLESKVSDTEVKLLLKAIEVETQTYEFYKSVVGQMEGNFQKMFAQFMEIEEGHVAIVQAELDAVNGDGFFFGMEEFNLEMG
jgi:rubrerythrin